MFQTERVPVQVFRSTDAGAPPITAAAGNLKTLFKACLLTGYGEGDARKEPLGWAMPFEDDHRAAFCSRDPKSHGYFLRVDSTNGRASVAEPFMAMSDLDNGSGLFGTARHYFGLTDYDGRIQRTSWLLVGHSRAFVFAWQQPNTTNQAHCNALFFGDVPSVKPADADNVLFWNNNTKSYAYFDGGLLANTVSQSGNEACFPNAANPTAPRSGLLHSLGFIGSGSVLTPYPDPLGSGFFAADIYITDKAQTGRCIYAKQPGLLAAPYQLFSRFDEFQPLPPFVGDSDQYVLCSVGARSVGYTPFIINVTAWEA